MAHVVERFADWAVRSCGQARAKELLGRLWRLDALKTLAA